MPGEKTERIAKKLEMAANIAIVIVALGVVAMFVRNYRADHSPARSPRSSPSGPNLL